MGFLPEPLRGGKLGHIIPRGIRLPSIDSPPPIVGRIQIPAGKRKYHPSCSIWWAHWEVNWKGRRRERFRNPSCT